MYIYVIRQKPEGAIKNGQSRDIVNIDHTKHRTKINKTINIRR